MAQTAGSQSLKFRDHIYQRMNNSRLVKYHLYYYTTIDSKSQAEKQEIKKTIDINMKFGARFDGLEDIRDEKIMQLEQFKVAYEQAESDANTIFSHKFIVERAVVADKKDKPKRIIIVLLATLGAFIFMVFALLINDRIRDLKKIA